MARDEQIRLPDGAAPTSYEVPNSAEIVPKAITALFDGTSAAATFLPVVEIVSDGGVVMSRTKAESTVAAGGSAEVTFAPFLSTAGASGSGGGGPAQWASLRVVYATPVSVPPFPSASYVIDPMDYDEVFYETSDPSIFSLLNTSHTTGNIDIVLTPGSSDFVCTIQGGVGIEESGGGFASPFNPAGFDVFVGFTYDGLLSSADPNSSAPYIYNGTNAIVTAPQTFWTAAGSPTSPDHIEYVTEYVTLTSAIGGMQPFQLTVANRDSTNPTIDLLYAWLKVTAFPATAWTQETIVPA